MIKDILAVFVIFFSLQAHAQISKSECRPEVIGSATLTEIRPQTYSVIGKLSGFDPCHKTVEFNIPRSSQKPPLMIYVHGGGGKSDGKDIVREFKNKGMATLLFDAYEMNEMYQGWRFFSVQVTLEARQRMIFKATFDAYKWALTRSDIDTTKIYFYGLSNGAVVAANLSAVVNPDHVPMIFAEGMPGSGLGLPDKPKVPITLIYGELDNYGGETENSWIWQRRDPCFVMQTDELTPPGSARNCSIRNKPVEEWVTEQTAQNSNIKIWKYQNAAHWIFHPRGLNKSKITVHGNLERFAYTGSDWSVQNRLIKDVMAVVNQNTVDVSSK